MIKRPELLAPAGSYDALRAALAAGADAVYVGGARFGARAYADNFDEAALCRAIDEVHLEGKKLYLTVNTLLKEHELKELYHYLKPYYIRGLDAVIVQDYGVLHAVRAWFPDLHVHCSTQMTVTGPEGALLLKRHGVSRIVTARELSLAEIRRIYEASGLEIEAFVHGALCYCYSGQCLFSSMLGGRSGNRGRCAQPCRLPYEAAQGKRPLNGDRGEYILSPKDMCAVALLPEILSAGVSSLKIEGRMKRPEYTAGVVEIYRKYLDLYLRAPGEYRVAKQDLEALFAIYNRDGFNQSYYKVRNGPEMMAMKNSKHTDGRRALAESRRREEIYARVRAAYEKPKNKEKIKGSFTIFSEMPAILTLYAGDVSVTVEKEGVQKAQNQPLTRERMERQLKKTGDSPFELEELEIFLGDDVFVPVQFLNELRREALARLEEELLHPYRRSLPGAGETEEPEEISRERGKAGAEQAGAWPLGQSHAPGAQRRCSEVDVRESGRMPLCRELPKGAGGEKTVLNASVETDGQLAAVLESKAVGAVYLGYELFQTKEAGSLFAQIEKKARQVRQSKKTAFLSLPHAVRFGELEPLRPFLERAGRDGQEEGTEETGVSGFLVRNLESYALLKRYGLHRRAVLDYSMYTLNSRAQRFFEEEEILWDTVSYELNERELKGRENQGSELVIYGHVPMMVSAQCVKKNLDRCTCGHDRLSIRDRYGKQFPVQCCCNTCYNVIYNSVPLSLLGEMERVSALGPRSCRLAFTVEDERRTAQVLRAAEAVLPGGKGAALSGEVTKGHFKRGVE